jgi:hypothetical protein
MSCSHFNRFKGHFDSKITSVEERLATLESNVTKFPTYEETAKEFGEGVAKILGEATSVLEDSVDDLREKLRSQFVKHVDKTSRLERTIADLSEEHLMMLRSNGAKLERIKALARLVLANLPYRPLSGVHAELLKEINGG